MKSPEGQAMVNGVRTRCAKCGQQLRVPKDIGGIVLQCPSCGHTFGSDFRLAGQGCGSEGGLAATIFELPIGLVARIIRAIVRWRGRRF